MKAYGCALCSVHAWGVDRVGVGRGWGGGGGESPTDQM